MAPMQPGERFISKYLIFAQASRGLLICRRLINPVPVHYQAVSKGQGSHNEPFHPYCDRDPTFCLIRDTTKNGKMRQFCPFLVQKVSGTCWHPFDLASAQCRSAFVDDWQMYRIPRLLDEIEVSNTALLSSVCT